MHHVGAGVVFLYAGYVSLYWQLAILAALGVAGVAVSGLVDKAELAEEEKAPLIAAEGE